MSEWVDIVVYAALIIAVWGWFPIWSSQLTVPVIADRNPAWLADHPVNAQQIVDSRWFRWSCLSWGLTSLLALLGFQVDVWPQRLAYLRGVPQWEALRDLNSFMLLAGLTYVAVCALLFFRWLHANVPLSSRRQATLYRRSIDDYVPPTIRYAIYGVIALHFAAWAAVGVTGRYVTGAFWGGMAFQVVISGVFLLLMATAVRRRPGAIDRIFGPGYRRSEVLVAFAAQLLPLSNGVARLYEHVVGHSSENVDRFMHLGLVLLVVALAMMLAAWSRPARTSRSTLWRRSMSAGALAFAVFVTMPRGAAQELSRAVSDDEIRRLLAVDGDTLFELASVTKAFTSLLLGAASID